MKNINKLAILAVAGAFALSSCSKKDAATVKELDGEWTVTSTKVDNRIKGTTVSGIANTSTEVYEATETYSISNGTISGTREGSSSEIEVYNGVSTTTTEKDPSKKVSGTATMTVKFDKKSGDYTFEEAGEEITEYTETETDTYEDYVYNYQTGTGSYVTITETMTRVVTKTDKYTETEKGTYYLNEKVGDAKSGTKLITDIKSDVRKGTITTVSKTTYSSSNSSTSTTSTSTNSETYESTNTRTGSSQTMVYDVIESTKKALSLDFVGSFKNVESSSISYTSTSGSVSQTTTTKVTDDQDVTMKQSIVLEKK